MKCKINRVSQVGIIVRDLEKAIQNFEKYLGVTEWDCFDTTLEEFPPLLINDSPGKLNIKGAIKTFPDRFEIELIQPVGEGPYMDYLVNHGPGVHHFAIMTPERNRLFREILDQQEKEGKKLWIHAKQLDGVEGECMDFAYLDLIEEMGSIVEIYNESRD